MGTSSRLYRIVVGKLQKQLLIRIQREQMVNITPEVHAHSHALSVGGCDVVIYLISIGCDDLIYLAMMLATSIAVGTHLDAYEGEAWPPAAAISEVMRPVGLVLMVVAVSAGVLTGLNGFFTAASRVLFTLGRANLVSSRLGELNGKQRISRNAIVLVCAVCLVTPWFGRAALTWVVDMSSAGIAVAYFYTCFCAWKIARTGQVPGMSKAIAPNQFYEYFALAGCILSIGFFSWRCSLYRARLACWERLRSSRWWSGLCWGWRRGLSRAGS